MGNDLPPNSSNPPGPRYEVRPSGISGHGGYALDRFQPGERIAQYSGPRISKEESTRRCAAGNAYIFTLDDTWDIDGATPENAARYFNHSCDPNCRPDTRNEEIWIVARREIQPGEEITFDYGYEMTDAGPVPCHCGAPNCYRFIVGAPYRWYPPGVEPGTASRGGTGLPTP